MQKGFSLIELLIALLISSILASLAYPNYQMHLTRTRRSEGQAALLNLATAMELYYAEHNTYQTATLGTGDKTDILSNHLSSNGWYQLSILNATDSTYTLQAIPLGAQAIHDIRCPMLTLNHLGIKSSELDFRDISISQITAECWKS